MYMPLVYPQITSIIIQYICLVKNEQRLSYINQIRIVYFVFNNDSGRRELVSKQPTLLKYFASNNNKETKHFINMELEWVKSRI